MLREKWLHRLVTLGLGLFGCLIFYLGNFPLPFLLGPMLACLAGAVAGAPMRDMGGLGKFMRTFLGVTVGTAVTPDLLDAIVGDMLATLALVPLFLLLVALICYPLLHFVCKLDHPTSWYAVMPGGLPDMVLFGSQAGGDQRTISLIHATRVVLLVTFAPMLIGSIWGLDLSANPGQSMSQIASHEIAMMVLAGFFGWKIAVAVGLFGASLIGPMLCAAALSLAGLIQHRPPTEIIVAAQFFVGIGVGAHYVGITAKEIRHSVAIGVLLSVILASISLACIEAIVLFDLADGLDSTLAFLPGGQAEMVVIGIVAGADLEFIVTHHLLRLVLVILLAPLGYRLFSRLWQVRGQ